MNGAFGRGGDGPFGSGWAPTRAHHGLMTWRTTVAVVGAMVLGGMVATGIQSAWRTEERTPRVGVVTRLEYTGEMHDMLERHRLMLQQMEKNASPAMLQLMNSDPMWQMMRSETWARLDEQHQADINRMLGRGSP